MLNLLSSTVKHEGWMLLMSAVPGAGAGAGGPGAGAGGAGAGGAGAEPPVFV